MPTRRPHKHVKNHLGTEMLLCCTNKIFKNRMILSFCMIHFVECLVKYLTFSLTKYW